jgi:hypothetical protein
MKRGPKTSRGGRRGEGSRKGLERGKKGGRWVRVRRGKIKLLKRGGGSREG